MKTENRNGKWMSALGFRTLVIAELIQVWKKN